MLTLWMNVKYEGSSSPVSLFYVRMYVFISTCICVCPLIISFRITHTPSVYLCIWMLYEVWRTKHCCLAVLGWCIFVCMCICIFIRYMNVKYEGPCILVPLITSFRITHIPIVYLCIWMLYEVWRTEHCCLAVLGRYIFVCMCIWIWSMKDHAFMFHWSHPFALHTYLSPPEACVFSSYMCVYFYCL